MRESKGTAGPVRTTVVVLAALAPVFLLVHLWRRSLLEDLTVEDGLVEYGTALLFLLSAVAFTVAGLTGRAKKLWVLPLAAACFLVAGEEVSWGQRLFGLGTPESLDAVNVQGETNLHNIEGIHGIVRAVAVLVLLSVFAALPLLVKHWGVARRLAARVRLPVPPLAALTLVVIGIGFMAGPRLLLGEQVFALDETGELYVAAAWMVYAISAYVGGTEVRRPQAGAETSVVHGSR